MVKLLSYIAALSFSVSLFAAESSDSSLFLRAVAEYSEQKIDSAYVKFLKLYEDNPKDDAVNYYLGLCEFSLRNQEAAEAHFKQAIQLDTANVWYKHTLTSFYDAVGDKVKFADSAEEMMKLKPSLYNTPFVITSIADARYSQRRANDALELYDKALEMDPDYVPAQFGRMETLYVQQNYPPFFAALDKFISNPIIKPELKSAYLEAFFQNMSSEIYWVWGEQLEKLVDVCVDLHPEELKARELKMNLLYIKEDWDGIYAECAKIAEIALKLSDKENAAMAYSMEGDVAYQQGDRKRAFKAYQNAIEVNPDYAPALNNYAYYLSEEKKSLKKAEKMSARTIELEPDNATYRDTYGWILFLLGRAEEAKPHFKHAMLYGGRDSSVVLEHYSKVLEALGETELSNYYKSLADYKKEQGK